MKKKQTVIFVILLCLVAFSFVYPLPYYISKPGFAHVLDDVVTVEEADQDDGQFFYTTVSMMQATPFTFALDKLKGGENIIPINQVRLEEESDEEYHVRQLQYMNQSKNTAIETAFTKSGEKVTEKTNGVYLLAVVDGTKASAVLQAGDLIQSIDDTPITSAASFIDYVQQKKEGDVVTVAGKRGSVEWKESIPLTRLNETGKVGLGISLVEDKTVTTERGVTFQTDEVGGPSAGLMFALEIYNQLVEEDISNGYKVAGTGELFEDGSVGRIGGIEHKVVAASRAGAEYFIAPDDELSPELKELYPDSKSNALEAAETIEREQLDIKLIPVTSFEDALSALSKL